MASANFQNMLSVRKFNNPMFANALSDLQLKKLATTARSERAWLDIDKGELLAPVLVPRQIGSAGYRAAQSLIVDTLSGLGYAISWDNFTASTPVGDVAMSNIIATKNPAAARRLVLSAHYESKIMHGGEFVGATDSAVPVALMLDIAKGLAEKLDQKKSDDITLQLVFFDGEEAYENWTQQDSIYGSRHLASFWQHNPDPATAAALRGAVDHKPELERVDLMVLLDLIGASNNEFVPLQQPTAGLFKQLGALESRLHDAKFISKTYMNTRAPAGAGYIDDDHRPFVERNVPVMHLISVPFPKVWHTLHDDGKALDPVVIEDMSLILRSFVASYLRLSV
ncbi:hypothetical protein GQ54DRAFT_298662 [Martensiomyces pterosporus]|nr:hypothetical protein GQ54DRAFT_298662 [Martensiomyces pterosporus]